MKYALIAALGATAALAACSPKADNQAAATTPAPATTASNSAEMSNMPMTAEAKMAKGTGTVTAVDAKAGAITVAHGPIPEAGWPAMTMSFKAGPAVVAQVKAGEKVDFDLKLDGGAAEITAVRKSQD